MNYQHVFHAGNFADVAKHVALLECLTALKRKPAPFMVLDTHAGRGHYDLRSAQSRKSGEAERGVLALARDAAAEPALAEYLAAVGARPGRAPSVYPGSPALIAAALRETDRAVCVEFVAAEARALTRELRSVGRVTVLNADGYQSLRALLPPPERRGLVLIDPPYEDPDESRRLATALAEAYERWPTGIFLVWYPIRSAAIRRSIHERFAALRIPKMLVADLAVHADDAGIGLAGSGLIIVNPPFGLDARLTESYGAIHRHLAAAGGYVDIERLTPEKW